MDKKYKIIYHKEDNDGLFSMAIIYNYLIHELHINKNNIDLEGSCYSDLEYKYDDETFSNLLNDYHSIILTDLSFNNIKRMKDLYNIKQNNFIWVDHHTPIIKESIKNGFANTLGLRVTNMSALLNMYLYLYDPLYEKYNAKELPEIFRILSGWDSFSYEREGYTLDYVRNVNVGVNSVFNLNPNDIIDYVYEIIYGDDDKLNLQQFLETGTAINKAKDLENEQLINIAGDFTFTINNEPACALFMQGATNSLIFKSVKDKVKHGIIFKRNKLGTWTISAYNTDVEYDKEFHIGNYLKEKYKGGGHAGAGGCTVKETKFIKILKSKAL